MIRHPSSFQDLNQCRNQNYLNYSLTTGYAKKEITTQRKQSNDQMSLGLAKHHNNYETKVTQRNREYLSQPTPYCLEDRNFSKKSKQNIDCNMGCSPFRRRNKQVGIKVSQTPTQISSVKNAFFKKHKRQLSSQLEERNQNVTFDANFETKRFRNTLNQQKEQFCQSKINLNLGCENKDGKKARYRVVSQEKSIYGLVYCPKCTITLVHKGFLMEEIALSQPDFRKKKQQLNSSKQQMQNQFKEIIEKISEQQQSDEQSLHAYYGSLIQIIKQCRQNDIQLIRSIYTKKMSELENKLRDINRKITLSNFNSKKSNQFQQILQEVNLRRSIDFDLISIFKNILQEQFRPKIIPEQNLIITSLKEIVSIKEQSTRLQESQTDTEALRFSFQQLIFEAENKKKKQNNFQRESKRERYESEDYISPIFENTFSSGNFKSIAVDVSSPTFKHF